MEPYDSDVQRQYIELCLDRGRRTEAIRRYELFRRRLVREFGDEPDFKLDDLRRVRGRTGPLVRPRRRRQRGSTDRRIRRPRPERCG